MGLCWSTPIPPIDINVVSCGIGSVQVCAEDEYSGATYSCSYTDPQGVYTVYAPIGTNIHLTLSYK